jgi:drug/metabolite transporter superfamily protein YnfA
VGTWGELLAAGEKQTLEFFFVRLKEVSAPTVDHHELLYHASVLAHYAHVSTHSAADLATPATLAEVFDNFVIDTRLRHDSTMMEAAGAQCLLLAGFFEDQLRRRHNIRWYAQLGGGFFSQAAALERSPKKVRLLAAIAVGFEPWRQRYARLSRDLRDQPYLLARPVRPVT